MTTTDSLLTHFVHLLSFKSSYTKPRGSLHVVTIKTRLGKDPEVGKIFKTQASVCTMVCISRYAK